VADFDHIGQSYIAEGVPALVQFWFSQVLVFVNIAARLIEKESVSSWSFQFGFNCCGGRRIPLVKSKIENQQSKIQRISLCRS